MSLIVVAQLAARPTSSATVLNLQSRILRSPWPRVYQLIRASAEFELSSLLLIPSRSRAAGAAATDDPMPRPTNERQALERERSELGVAEAR
jgi:hypothetical protein